MRLEQRTVGSVVIVKVSGDVTLGKGNDVLLKDKVLSLVQQGHKNVLLDLGEVSHMDSSGLGQLVHAHVTTKKCGGSLKLLNLTKRLHDLLVITKLSTVFDVYDNEAAAIASY